MANLLKLKRTAVPGRSPQNSDLVLGELAVNTYDGKIFFKTDQSGVESVIALSRDYNDLINKPSDTLFNITGDDSTQRTINRGETFKVSGTNGISVTTDPEGNLTVSLNSLAANPLVFTTSGNYRTLTGYQESGSTYSVRTAMFDNNLLRLELATFTPILSSTPTPGSSISWDVACTGFNVSVDNPTDFTTQYINGVSSIVVQTGIATALVLFTAGAKSATPAGGIDWTQSFTTNAGSYIRPNVSSGISGGTAQIQVRYNFWDGANTTLFGNVTTFTVNWATPTTSIVFADLSGNTFLDPYEIVPYTVTTTGLNNSANASHAVTASGGTLSSATGSGNFTCTAPIHKDNTASARSVSVTTTFTRPSAVTGISYTANASSSDSTISVDFTYPSFWIFTGSVVSPPTRADIVFGYGFEAAVTVLANQTKVFSSLVNNPTVNPRVFWFGIRASASQPTSFRTGSSQSLLSDVSYSTGSVSLNPDVNPAGYNSENYQLYGIILQPGDTYVSIS
jgi:hypothetical protein